MRPLLVAVLAVALAPRAAALDVLPSESRLGDTEARILVRAAGGEVTVRAEPPVLAGVEGSDDRAPTPRTLRATGNWRGMEGIVIVELERADASVPVEIVLEDGAGGAGRAAGAWIEWPGASVAVASAHRQVPGGLVPVALALLGAALMRRQAAARACATR